MNYLHLSRKPLDVNAINQTVVSNCCGAISMFCGITRNNFNGKRVICLEYEAYEPMALKEMQLICDEARKKWPDIKHIAIYHRLGVVPVCETSVVIAISSTHRQASLHALTFVIDTLKQRVPIWKKEKYCNNEYAWKENKECKNILDYNLDESVITDENSIEVTVPKDFIQISATEDEVQRRIECFVGKKREEINLNNILDYTTIQKNASTAVEEVASLRESDNDGAVITEGCARTNSTIIKQESSKCHLKVRRLENHYPYHHHYESSGLQHSEYLQTLHKLMTNNIADKSIIKMESGNDAGSVLEPQKQTVKSCRLAIRERIEALEQHLNLPKLYDKEIIRRLKNIEDRVLYLESISPEYKHFLAIQERHNDYYNSKAVSCANDLNPTKIRRLSSYHHQQRKTCYTVNDIDNFIERISSSPSIPVVNTHQF